MKKIGLLILFSTLLKPLYSQLISGSVGILDDCKVWVWGDYNYDLWGNGKVKHIKINEIDNVIKVNEGFSGGYPYIDDMYGRSPLALTEDGSVYTWGEYDTSGYLMNFCKNTDIYTKKPFMIFENAADILSGYTHNIALHKDGTVWTWGWGVFGQLGNGKGIDNTCDFMPKKVDIDDVIGIAAGGDGSYALKKDGSVWEWGNASLGSAGMPEAQFKPFRLSQYDDVVKIRAYGYKRIILIKKNGTLRRISLSGHGYVGGVYQRTFDVEDNFLGLKNIIDLKGSPYHAIALDTDGSVWVWGNNSYGQVGDGTNEFKDEPYKIESLKGIIGIGFLYDGGTYAYKENGDLYAWGYNYNHDLGLNNADSIVKNPTLVKGVKISHKQCNTTKVAPSIAINGNFQILGSGIAEITIYNILGQVIHQTGLVNLPHSISLQTTESSSMYIAHIKRDGVTEYQKIIVFKN